MSRKKIIARKKAIEILILLSVFVVCYFITAQYLSEAGRADQARESILDIDFSCGQDCQDQVKPWNASGYSRACYKNGVPHGRILFWEEGYLNLEGFFTNGRKDGTWTVFNPDGTVYVKIFFENGIKKGKEYY